MRGTPSLLPPPEGFEYREEMLSRDEEQALIASIQNLELQPFEFQSYLAKRQVKSFGWRYDYGDYSLKESDEIPTFLHGIRDKAAAFAGLAPNKLIQALVTEYTPGTPIGWHRDRSVFDEVIGISLLSRCTFRLRRKVGTKWERHTIILEPRSMYILRGPARTEWEHSIPEVTELRYSITFRTLK